MDLCLRKSMHFKMNKLKEEKKRSHRGFMRQSQAEKREKAVSWEVHENQFHLSRLLSLSESSI